MTIFHNDGSFYLFTHQFITSVPGLIIELLPYCIYGKNDRRTVSFLCVRMTPLQLPAQRRAEQDPYPHPQRASLRISITAEVRRGR